MASEPGLTEMGDIRVFEHPLAFASFLDLTHLFDCFEDPRAVAVIDNFLLSLILLNFFSRLIFPSSRQLTAVGVQKFEQQCFV